MTLAPSTRSLSWDRPGWLPFPDTAENPKTFCFDMPSVCRRTQFLRDSLSRLNLQVIFQSVTLFGATVDALSDNFH